MRKIKYSDGHEYYAWLDNQGDTLMVSDLDNVGSTWQELSRKFDNSIVNGEFNYHMGDILDRYEIKSKFVSEERFDELSEEVNRLGKIIDLLTTEPYDDGTIKVGDQVAIVEDESHPLHCFSVGDVATVIEVGEYNIVIERDGIEQIIVDTQIMKVNIPRGEK